MKFLTEHLRFSPETGTIQEEPEHQKIPCAYERKEEDTVRILIIEDNRRLAESIQDTLKQIWYESDICTDGNSGACLMQTGGYDGVILDLMLPGKDGLTILKESRSAGCQTPVLILTARSEVEDRVRGLDTGADYYLTKPFEGRELIAVMKSIVRRQGDWVPACLTFGSLSLDEADFCLKGPEKRIQLGKKEYEIMRILMRNREVVVSKETLLQNVWGNERDASENNVEIYISFLRKKLKYLQVREEIVTMRQFGYRLTRADMSDRK